MAKFLFFLFSFLTISLILPAQEKIATDRPDQTESSVLVPPHYFQAEFGFGKENLDKENYNLVHPTALFKYGLSKRFELRLETNYVSAYEHLIPQSKTITGFEPIRIGFRTAYQDRIQNCVVGREKNSSKNIAAYSLWGTPPGNEEF